MVTKSGSPFPSPSRRKAELRILISHNFFICAWIFTKFGGIYSGTGRNMPQTLNFTKLSRYRLNLDNRVPGSLKVVVGKAELRAESGF